MNPILRWDEHQEAARDAAIHAFARTLDPADPFVAIFRDAALPMAISDPTLADNPIIYANDAFERLTGYSRNEVMGRNCRFLQGPLTNAAHVDRLRDAIERQVKIELDLLNHRKDGTPFWNRLAVAPVFDANGTVRYFIASQHDVTLERNRLAGHQADQRALQDEADRSRVRIEPSAAQIEAAMRAARLGVWTFDPATRRFDATAACKTVFGRTPDDTFGYKQLMDIIEADDRQGVVDAFETTTARRVPWDIEFRIVTLTGETRWVSICGELAEGLNGGPVTMSGVSADVTDRKRTEDHRSVLANELTHRVKNTLATVSAIVNQSLRDAASMSAARDTIGGRIASLAVAHDLLLRDEVEGASISDIVRGVMAPFDDGVGKLFTVSGPYVRLEPRVTLALSMALHELATNASKYGALSTGGGHVTIEWSVGIGASGRQLSFRWTEDGGPRVSPPEKTGFGSRMIERVLVQHTRGDAAVEYRPEGLVFTICAPL